MNHYMVFDMGGSEIKHAVMTEDGTMLKKGASSAYPDHFEDLIQSLVHIIKDEEKHTMLSGVAISSPGSVDHKTGIVHGSSALPCIHGPNLKDILFKETSLHVEIENDANCAALGELWKGAAKDHEDVLCVVLGSGIGGAVIKNRRIHKGHQLHGGEFGYMAFQTRTEDGQRKFQSWSELAAVTAIARQAARMKNEPAASWNGKRVFSAAEAGDPDCLKIIDDFYFFLALGLFNIQYVYDPEKIIIGGAISSRSDLIPGINSKLDTIMAEHPAATVRPVLESCFFRNDANLIGALYHFLEQQGLHPVTGIA